MSLIQDTKDIKSALDSLENKAKEQQLIYFNLISEMVKLHQKYRILKMYEVSDEIRTALNGVGVQIIQGTAQYDGYENIPSNLRNRQFNDTWKIK